jgi:hypothetical protein
MTEAVAQFQKGLDLLARVPIGASHEQHELEPRTALGPALMTTQGYSAPALIETVERARLLADHLGRSDYPLALLYGQRQVHIARAEHRLSLAQAEQIEKTR